MNIKNFKDTYRNKTVLITGHTGFKGSWLAIWLHELGAKVIGYALDPLHPADNFSLSGLTDTIVDIRAPLEDLKKVKEVFAQYKPDYVFHLAAQSLVQASYIHPLETYRVNVLGTVHILEAIRQTHHKTIGIMVTTDKCYENREQIWGYRETDPLGGFDPYSSSKGCAEIAISSWRNSFFPPDEHDRHQKAIASVRAGNVIGGGDWAENRILPDSIKALEKNVPIQLRNPEAVRPWEHVLEPLSGYLLLGQRLSEQPAAFGEAWNFGPDQDSFISVLELARKVVTSYGSGSIEDISDRKEPHEAKLLTLDTTKARHLLGWKPTWDIDTTIEKTIEWYRAYQKKDVYELCVSQIEDFV